MRLYAQVTDQGTAMPETALCENCVKIAAFRAQYSASDNDPDLDRQDVTGNQVIQEVGCQSCGWPSRIEWAEFLRHIKDAFPFSEVEEDDEGQLVIYTGLVREQETTSDGSWVTTNAILLP